MTTRQTHGLASASAASAAVLLIWAANAAAQQPPAAPAMPASAAATSTQSSTTPIQRPSLGTATPRPLKRDALGAAKPAGYNPSFSPDGQHFVQQGGAQLYQAICQACHMPQGQGAQGAGFYPALTNNPRMASSAYPTYVVLAGLRGMPPFAERLTDQQVAEVVNYVRTNFGNTYQDAVTPESVNVQRSALER
ncbi:c-type cytochrome [Polaromonas glacialis]|uniref:c-type cytochrome n=1 Tax=Polaromonas glacialis TaxID=866564 RepID=UPI000689CF21|nr:cytochrome c [Polaromonas glacialis]